jgi:hypothetical protein
LAFGACGLIVMFAVLALLAGDPKAAAIMATQALLALCLACSASKRERARGV